MKKRNQNMSKNSQKAMSKGIIPFDYLTQKSMNENLFIINWESYKRLQSRYTFLDKSGYLESLSSPCYWIM